MAKYRKRGDYTGVEERTNTFDLGHFRECSLGMVLGHDSCDPAEKGFRRWMTGLVLYESASGIEKGNSNEVLRGQ